MAVMHCWISKTTIWPMVKKKQKNIQQFLLSWFGNALGEQSWPHFCPISNSRTLRWWPPSRMSPRTRPTSPSIRTTPKSWPSSPSWALNLELLHSHRQDGTEMGEKNEWICGETIWRAKLFNNYSLCVVQTGEQVTGYLAWCRGRLAISFFLMFLINLLALSNMSTKQPGG